VAATTVCRPRSTASSGRTLRRSRSRISLQTLRLGRAPSVCQPSPAG
jgi:hypothetical protein